MSRGFKSPSLFTKNKGFDNNSSIVDLVCQISAPSSLCSNLVHRLFRRPSLKSRHYGARGTSFGVVALLSAPTKDTCMCDSWSENFLFSPETKQKHLNLSASRETKWLQVLWEKFGINFGLAGLTHSTLTSRIVSLWRLQERSPWQGIRQKRAWSGTCHQPETDQSKARTNGVGKQSVFYSRSNMFEFVNAFKRPAWITNLWYIHHFEISLEATQRNFWLFDGPLSFSNA